MPAGTRLTPYYGDLVIRDAGTVIDSLDIYGLVRVEAANVTITKSRIHGRPLTGNMALIYAGSEKVSNLVIEDVELVADQASADVNGLNGANFTARRLNIHGVVDSVHIFGDNATVRDSWMHDNLHYDRDPNWKGGPSHDDNIQIQRGDNIKILNNSLSGAVNSALQITQNEGRTSNVTFAGNLASGGACTVNVSQAGPRSGAIDGLVLRNNVFGSSTYNCPMIVDGPTMSRSTIEGNRRTNGGPAPVQWR